MNKLALLSEITEKQTRWNIWYNDFKTLNTMWSLRNRRQNEWTLWLPAVVFQAMAQERGSNLFSLYGPQDQKDSENSQDNMPERKRTKELQRSANDSPWVFSKTLISICERKLPEFGGKNKHKVKENIPDPHARLGRVPVPESQTKKPKLFGRVYKPSLSSGK